MSGRIAYLLKKFPRLSETFVLGEILGQEELGRDVVVYSRRTPDDEPRHPELDRLRAEIVEVPAASSVEPFSLLVDLANDDPELVRRLGDAVARLSRCGVARITKLAAEALWLRADVLARGIDHVHVHFATESAIVANVLRALGGPGYSITAHAKDIYRETVDPKLLELLVGESEFTVTVCDANVEHLRSMLPDTAMERVRRLYNGIDRATFQGVERRPRARRVLSIGRLVEKKGFDTLLDAFAILARRGVQFDAEIVGEGEERARLERRAREAGLASSVRFLGALPADRVREQLGLATIFALPCRIGADGNRDALPTVLLEAQAARVPIVSCPVSGVSEILDEGRAGVLVPEADPVSLADAIARMLDRSDELHDLVEHGAQLGAREFDRGVQARVLGEWFDAAVLVGRETCASRT